jgi:glycosyltransferase involved in cell wall biosynthesis
MRIAYLASGAAGMYCGSCMRDNTLAAALLARGRDVVLVPLYTPLRTDEPDVSEPRVFYGGINVYLQHKSAFFRHTPWLLDRILDSSALLRTVSRWTARSSPEDLGRLTVSILRGQRGAQRKELRKLIRWLRDLRPALVNLPNAMFVALARPIKEALGVPVLCSLTGEDIFLATLPPAHQAEAIELIRRGGADVDGFIAVSRYYASYARESFAIPEDRLHIIPLGVCIDNRDEPPAVPQEPFTIGYLARICPAKGLHILCEAFVRLRRQGRACQLRIAGYLGESDRPYLEEIRRHMADQGLSGDFQVLGEVNRAEKLSFLRSLHVLSVPTMYREAKGLYVLEALANGVPVVQPDHGAFPEMIRATGGGLLVEPHNPQAVSDAIARLMDDPELRNRLGCQGRSAVLESFTDEVMAERTWSLYERYVSQHNPAR